MAPGPSPQRDPNGRRGTLGFRRRPGPHELDAVHGGGIRAAEQRKSQDVREGLAVQAKAEAVGVELRDGDRVPLRHKCGNATEPLRRPAQSKSHKYDACQGDTHLLSVTDLKASKPLQINEDHRFMIR